MNFTNCDSFLNADNWTNRDEMWEMMEGTHQSSLEEVIDRWNGQMLQLDNNNFIVTGWSVDDTEEIMDNYQLYAQQLESVGTYAVAQCWEASNSGNNKLVLLALESDKPVAIKEQGGWNFLA